MECMVAWAAPGLLTFERELSHAKVSPTETAHCEPAYDHTDRGRKGVSDVSGNIFNDSHP